MKRFKMEFTEKNLTGNAGLVHFGKFVKKLNLRDILANHINIEQASNTDYHVADVIIMLLMGVLAGAKHMSHMVRLRMDTVIRILFNWDKFPADSTFSRIFKKFSASSCHELSEVEDKVRRKVWNKKWFGRITLDLDSSVRGVFGSQEGAAKGYNPKKKGQKSYHPVFCFIAETRECLHSWFRTGSAYSANGAVEFVKECFEKLPKRIWKVFLRADSAFFNGNLLDFLESQGALYLIKVRMKGLLDLLLTQEWHKVRNNPNFEVTKFEYKCAKWKRPRKFLAVREITIIISDDVLSPEYEYQYFCYVTNEKLAPLKAHKKYGKRGASENWIQWCKEQMASGSILTDTFWANSAIFQICILAYNLQAWLMWLATGDGLKEEPCTIRFWLIHVPAKLLTGSRQYTLKLSKNAWFKNRWLQIEDSISNMEFN